MLSAISSCSKTKTVATWTDSEYKGGPLKKMLSLVSSKIYLAEESLRTKLQKYSVKKALTVH